MDLVIRRRRPLDGGTGAGGVDEGHDDPVRGRAVDRSGDEDAGSEMGLGNREGGSVQTPSVTDALGAHRRMLARAGCHLGERGGQAEVTGHQRWEPAGLLLGRPEVRHRQGTEDDRRPQGHRRHGATLLLEDEAQLGETQARTPVCLGDRQAEKIGLGKLGPQGLVEAVSDRPRSLPRAPPCAMPWKIDAAASDTANCSSVNSKSIRPLP